MSSKKIIALVTGANRGLGLEVASQLMAKGAHVIVASRSVASGVQALKQLEALGHPGSADSVQLDVSDEASVAAAAKKVEADHGRLDALVNNAGVADFPDMSLSEQMTKAFAINALGPELMVEAFWPLLKKSTTTPRVVNVSTGAGSIGRRFDKSAQIYGMSIIPYRSSKAALNMITANQAVMYGEQGLKVFAYCPGFIVSGLSDKNTSDYGAKPTSEGARPLVDIVYGKRDAEHGCFLNADGQWPW